MKKNEEKNRYQIQSFLANLAMWITQDVILKFFFSKKIIEGKEFLNLVDGPMIIAPTHRSRWDGLILTFAIGRRVTNRDCRFMVTTPEMKGLQGWFLKRLGCFSINQKSPSLVSLRYAVELIFSKNQLVIFPEGKITKNSRKLKLELANFNQTNFREKKLDFTTSSLPQRTLYLIRTFDNEMDVMRYFSSVKNNARLQVEIQAANAKPYIISLSNFRTLFKEKNEQVYLEFFNKKYPG